MYVRWLHFFSSFLPHGTNNYHGACELVLADASATPLSARMTDGPVCHACWVPACLQVSCTGLGGRHTIPHLSVLGGCTRAQPEQGSYVVPACGTRAPGLPSRTLRMHQRRNACAGAVVCSEHAELYHYAVLHGLVLYRLFEERSACRACMLSMTCWRSRHCAPASRHWLGGVITDEAGKSLRVLVVKLNRGFAHTAPAQVLHNPALAQHLIPPTLMSTGVQGLSWCVAKFVVVKFSR